MFPRLWFPISLEYSRTINVTNKFTISDHWVTAMVVRNKAKNQLINSWWLIWWSYNWNSWWRCWWNYSHYYYSRGRKRKSGSEKLKLMQWSRARWREKILQFWTFQLIWAGVEQGGWLAEAQDTWFHHASVPDWLRLQARSKLRTKSREVPLSSPILQVEWGTKWVHERVQQQQGWQECLQRPQDGVQDRHHQKPLRKSWSIFRWCQCQASELSVWMSKKIYTSKQDFLMWSTFN